MDPDCTDSDEDTSETDDICFPGKVSEIKPKRLTIHPEYIKNKESARMSSYDIAIIELKRPARLSKIIQIIALPSKDTCDKEPDHPLFVTGFGKFKYIFKNFSPSCRGHGPKRQLKKSKNLI